MELVLYMEERRKKIDAFLENHFTIPQPDFGRLFEAMRYSLVAGGKRIRPILMLAAYEACGGPQGGDRFETALRVASALEMIHTYSLIHDDLPAMDNDDLRRGSPTNHKKFGEATAILAGDSLLTEAFEVIAGSRGVSGDILIEIIRDIARASGGCGMAGGQALDLDSEGRRITAGELEKLHRHKTGCLIEVSVNSGAKLAETTLEKSQGIKTYGEAMGLAFQIADDILDVEGGTAELGKTAGSDAKKDKATYPSLLGLEKSKQVARECADRALTALAHFDEKAEPLRQIAAYIIFRKS